MTKEMKIEFAPGCFDHFDGTQEELDEFIAQIRKMAESGELFEQSRAVDLEELLEEDPEWAEKIIDSLENTDIDKRKLQ